ncbi:MULTISPECIES: hypothetical protein [Clostridium]|jgi:hypothetical protein|uniref:hypothetical protein n=1 Tax=Clostridium TaxID=1485 RepID=UPI00243033AA|nr:hypothetical protein [Clostridium tyrobutyricum]
MDNLDLLNSLGMSTEKNEPKEEKNNEAPEASDVQDEIAITEVEDTPEVQQEITAGTENNETETVSDKGTVKKEEKAEENTTEDSNNNVNTTGTTNNIDSTKTGDTFLNLFEQLGMGKPKSKETKKENKKNNTSTKNTVSKPKATEIDKDKTKIVKAYGQEVMTIPKGEKGDLQEIREYLVNTLGYREFQKDDTDMIIINDGDTQYIIPQPKFRAKG